MTEWVDQAASERKLPGIGGAKGEVSTVKLAGVIPVWITHGWQTKWCEDTKNNKAGVAAVLKFPLIDARRGALVCCASLNLPDHALALMPVARGKSFFNRALSRHHHDASK